MNSSSDLLERWQRLTARPLTFIGPDSLAECFSGAVPAGQLEALRNLSRFEGRLLRLLRERFELSPWAEVPEPDPADLPVLLLSPLAFSRLTRLCGAIWHGATLRREIRGEVLGELHQRLGAEVFAQALSLPALAGAADLLRDPAELVAAIERDGQTCVAAWLHLQPESLKGWLSLRLDSPRFDQARLSRDIEIVRGAAALLSAEEAPDKESRDE
ncbi:type III secretion protein [Pseudomonas gingeri NCPPB 3146 = LMG 5327]|uniref:Type III secretion protein n=2 Tax=Pseudomonas gingeri TaxID=117681 RepID=A0A7Y7XWC1_9PSED|nr:hypothetical protein [Pseudomonas gingeri]NWC13530.1 type III secretion protein [Pseudomonas gingeri]NWE50763.1 type III secretion protein [Pseudomonas gingeri]PNQ90236.1 type III secretion protein [Pseudomonas gingeri NCPPB 3146 = LMG 5327]